MFGFWIDPFPVKLSLSIPVTLITKMMEDDWIGTSKEGRVPLFVILEVFLVIMSGCRMFRI